MECLDILQPFDGGVLRHRPDRKLVEELNRLRAQESKFLKYGCEQRGIGR